MIVMDIIMHQITPTTMPLPLFKPMAQSQRGVTQVMEVGVPLMVQVVLSILKPAGSVGATVQLAIVPHDSDGYYNASNYPNYNAFATIQADGSISAWGDSGYGGTGVPSGSSYTKIYSNRYAFAKSNVCDGRTNNNYLTCSIRNIRGGCIHR
jgi:hypothetical protein